MMSQPAIPATFGSRFWPPQASPMLSGLGAVILLWTASLSTWGGEPEIDLLKPRTPLESPGTLITAVVFAPDGKSIAFGTDTGTVHLCDAESGKQVRSLAAGDRPISSVAFSPDGTLLVATSARHSKIRTWDAASGEVRPALFDEGDFGIHEVVFAPDGASVVAACSDGTTRLLNVAGRRVTATFAQRGAPVLAVAWAPDGKTIATAAGATVSLWEVSTQVRRHALQGHAKPIRSVAFSPDGKLLATGSEDHSARLWDVASAKPTASLEGHGGTVNCVRFSPNGRLLACASEGPWKGILGHVRLWDVTARRELGGLVGDGYDVQTVAFSPQHVRLTFAGSFPGIWDLPPDGENLLRDSPADPVAKLIRALANKNPQIRRDAAEVLATTRPVQPTAVMALVKSLADTDTEAATSAAAALGRMGKDAHAAIPALLEIAKSNTNDGTRRAFALTALGGIGGEPDRVIPVLLQGMKDPDVMVAWGSVVASAGYRKTHGPQFVMPLVDVIRRPAETQREVSLPIVACEALDQLTNNEVAAPAVPALVDHLVKEIDALRQRKAAARRQTTVSTDTDWQLFAAGKVGGTLAGIHQSMKEKNPAVVPVLTALSKESSTPLAGVVGTAASSPAEVVKTLLPALKDTRPQVRRGAALAMGARPEASRDHLPDLATLLDDPQPSVRIASAEALLRIDRKNAAAVGIVAEALRDADEELRLAALMLLRDLSQAGPMETALMQATVPTLIGIIQSDRVAERFEALTAVYSIGGAASEASAAVAEIAFRGAPRERGLAVFVLSRIGAKGMPPVVSRLADMNPRVRERAAQILAEVTASERPWLGAAMSAAHRQFKQDKAKELTLPGDEAILALTAATKDADDRVRWRAAIALGEVGPRAAASVPNLVTLLKDRVPFVRWDAAWALGEIDPNAAVDQRRQATADQLTIENGLGDRFTVLRLDPPLPATLEATEQIQVRLAADVRSAEQIYLAMWPYFGDKPARCGNGPLILVRKGQGGAENFVVGPGPLDRLRFFGGDEHVNPEKFQFEFSVDARAEWKPAAGP